jgi:hypothetical protein
MAIVAGVILLAYFMLTYKEPQPQAAPSVADDQPSL